MNQAQCLLLLNLLAPCLGLIIRGDESPESPNLEWIMCGEQFMYCECPGKIRWGNDGKWMNLGVRTEPVHCHFEKLGDPAPGDAGKHCECQVETDSDFYRQRLNPSVHANWSNTAAVEVASCEIFEQGKDDGLWGREQWHAMEHFCRDPGHELPAGKEGMDFATLRDMVRGWIEPKYLDNYRRVYGSNGWVDEAFVNFVGNSPTGTKYAQMNKQLIRSVHAFSSRPVIVVHFGMAAPLEWDPVQFPRLVVVHAAALPHTPYRRFDFNKYRSIMLTRVRTGIQLDSDQFVTPGVDAFFKRVAEEITEEYPMPILPVHFLKNEELPMWPKNGHRGVRMSAGESRVFDRFCKAGSCPGVTTRWGHAHPTWTFWALPFFSRWLRRQFRDETLPAKTGEPGTELRVYDIDVDEDLLNIGIWEANGHKQWCKYDIMDPTEFHKVIKWDSKDNCGVTDTDIQADPVFHKIGAAQVFWTAHHAVDPVISRGMITQLQERQKLGKLPPPILFKGCWYKDRADLVMNHPNISCLI